MHDPMVVAFEIRRPWPKRSNIGGPRPRWSWRPPFCTVAGRGFYFPAVVTVWHVEPDGRDAFEVCKHSSRWRWHVRHWHLQVQPLQRLRRQLLTRCAWCAGPSRHGAPVNVSEQWDGPRGRWWKGEPNLFHAECALARRAHRACTCDDPLTEHRTGGGRCARCGHHRQYNVTARTLHLYRGVKAQCGPGQYWGRADTARVLADAPAEATP